MKIEDLKDKKVLLFGKSRSFSTDELKMQSKVHGITIVEEYEDGVEYVVDGAMMSPAQTIKSDEIYEAKKAEFLKIELLEDLLSDAIDEDVLMMSLKLSSDKKRLINFLINENINDKFYFKLLSMYDWGGDDFYENDENRDVTASIIRRFYKNIERNHNIEFSKLGLMHLVVQTNNSELLEVITSLKPLKKSFDKDEKDHGYRIVTSIATNFYTPNSALKKLIKGANIYVKKLISMRDFLDEELQKQLYDLEEKEILDSLVYCKNLSEDIYKLLRDNNNYAHIMAQHIELNKERYEFFQNNFAKSLAKNKTITKELEQKLLKHNIDDIKEALASNEGVSTATILELLKKGDDKIDFSIYSNPATPENILIKGSEDLKNHFALAQNKSTPSQVLEKIYKEADAEVLKELAKNRSTPVDILYQLHLDSRYERYVKENPSFGKHIQQENIGWLV